MIESILQFEIQCDRMDCNNVQLSFFSDSLEEARAEFQIEGWWVKGDKHLCPQCHQVSKSTEVYV